MSKIKQYHNAQHLTKKSNQKILQYQLLTAKLSATKRETIYKI